MQSSPAALITAATEFLCTNDPVLKAVIEQIGPCTLVPSPDIFAALVDAIVSQQISVKAADAIMARVRAAMPDGLITPENMQALTFDDLRALGLSSPKARYVQNLLEHVASGQLAVARLSELDDEQIIEELTAVKGIGRWTAEMCLIFVLMRPDIFPVDDLGLLEGIRVAYQLPERPAKKEALARGESWRPYRTFATWYLWAFRRASM